MSSTPARGSSPAEAGPPCTFAPVLCAAGGAAKAAGAPAPAATGGAAKAAGAPTPAATGGAKVSATPPRGSAKSGSGPSAKAALPHRKPPVYPRPPVYHVGRTDSLNDGCPESASAVTLQDERLQEMRLSMRQSIRGLYSTMYQGLLRLDNVPHPSDAELELARARSEEAQRECDRLRGEAEQLRSKVSELEAKASGRESLATVGQQLEAIRSQFATLSSGQGDLMPSVVSVASVREVVTAEVCVGTQDYPFQAPPAKVEAWKNKIAAARKETSDAKLEIERLKAEIARTSGKRKAEDPVPPPGKIAKNGAGRVEANSGAGTSSCKGQSALPLPGCVPIGKRRLQELESAEAELVTVRRQASQSSANAERWQNIAIKNGNDAKTAKGRIENMEKEQATNRARIAELKHQVHVAALRTQAVNQDTAARLEGMERRAQQSRIELESYRQRLSEMNVVTIHQQERVAALEADLGAKVSELATAATILRTNEQHIEELRRQLAASQRETNSQHIEELRRQLTAAQQEANKYQKLWTEAEKAVKEYRNPTSGGSGSSGSYTPSDRSRPRRRW